MTSRGVAWFGLLTLCVALAVPFEGICQGTQDPWRERLDDERVRDYLEFPPEIVEEGPEMDAGFYESLRTLTLWRLAETIDLGEEELVTFFPKFSSLEKARQQFREHRTMHMEALEHALASDDLKRIKSAIQSYQEAREQFTKHERELEGELLKVLTIEQQAQYLIFMETVAPEIEGMLRAFHQLRSRRGGNAHP